MTTENNLPTEENPQDTPPADEALPADDAPADPPPEDAPPAEDGDVGKPSRGGAAERIQELVAERNAAMEWGEYWYRQAIAQRTPQQQDTAPAQPADDAPPKLEDFDSTEKWAAAYAKWTRDTIGREVEAKTYETVAKHREEAERVSAQEKWQERMAKFAEQHPDAQRVIANPTLPITKAMSEVITASENGPALAYHLGKNPVEAARIARMSPTQQAAALGRLEAKLASAPAPRPRPQVSRAPVPPAPIDGAGTPSVDLENCSLNEFLERRLGKKRRA